jgi:hypothetical protein
MAATFDATANSKVLNATSLTFSHTCTGTNLVLIVGTGTDGGIGIANITYAAVGITPISAITSPGGFNGAEQWGKIAPATGANNVVITADSATGIVGGSVSASGADQSTGWGAATTANGTDAAPTVNVTSETGALVVDAHSNGVNTPGNPTVTVHASQVQRWNDYNANKNRGAGSTEAGAATVTMSWTLSGSEEWCISGVGIKPAAGGATFAPKPFLYNQAVRRAAFY